MRRALGILVPALSLLVGCTRPEVEAFRLRPAPILVTVNLPPQVPERALLEREYAAALRARLATRAEVVPEGVVPPPGAAHLQVNVRELRPGGGPDPAAVGLATGVAVGALSAAAGNRGYSVFDGLFWGLFAGAHTAAAQAQIQRRLGYQPQAISAEVSLTRPGFTQPLYEDSVSPSEVVRAMAPLPWGSREAEARIAEEEARALARVVVDKLAETFQWTRRLTPAYTQGLPPAPAGDAGEAEARPSSAAPTAPPPPPPAEIPPPPGAPAKPN